MRDARKGKKPASTDLHARRTVDHRRSDRPASLTASFSVVTIHAAPAGRAARWMRSRSLALVAVVVAEGEDLLGPMPSSAGRRRERLRPRDAADGEAAASGRLPRVHRRALLIVQTRRARTRVKTGAAGWSRARARRASSAGCVSARAREDERVGPRQRGEGSRSRPSGGERSAAEGVTGVQQEQVGVAPQGEVLEAVVEEEEVAAERRRHPRGFDAALADHDDDARQAPAPGRRARLRLRPGDTSGPSPRETTTAPREGRP